jgi:hypothetical protein
MNDDEEKLRMEWKKTSPDIESLETSNHQNQMAKTQNDSTNTSSPSSS